MSREPMNPELEELLDAERVVDELPASVHADLRAAIAARLGTPGGGGGGGGGGPSGRPNGGAPPSGSTLGQLAIAGLVGVVLGYGARWIQEPSSEPATAVTAATAATAAETLTEPPDESTPPRDTPVTVMAPPSMASRTPPVPPVVPDLAPGETTMEVAAADPPASPRRAERILIDRARAALSQGAHQEVLRTLLRHETDHPRGSLVEDREALRIRALLGLGQRDRAARAFGRFQTRYPSSPYASSLRQELNP